MSLVVETGEGLATAESYCSVADATTYHANLGNAAWAALTSDTIREQCLRKATIYLEGRYRSRWKGYRNTATQALSWPRAFVYLEPFYLGAVGSYPYLVASNVVPVEVKNACASLALRAATVTLMADESRTASSETVGPISITYDAYSGQAVRYKEIDTMLHPYMKSGGGQVPMVRA